MSTMTGKALSVLLTVAKDMDAKIIGAYETGPADTGSGVRKFDLAMEGDLNAGTSTITMQPDKAGQGLFMPWLQNQPNGSGEMMTLCSFSRPISAGDRFSWVVTGPFSGCRATVFKSGGAYVFAHVVTGEGCRSISQQQAGVIKTLGADWKLVNETRLTVTSANTSAFQFWMRIDGVWHQRCIEVSKNAPLRIIARGTLSKVE